MKAILSLIFITLFFSASAQIVSRQDEAAIMKQLRQMEDHFRAKNLLGVASVYLDNSYLISPGESTTGRKAINEYWTSIKNPVDWKLSSTFITYDEKSFFESSAYKALRNKPPGWEKLPLDLSDVVYQLGVSELKSLWQGKESLSTVNFILIWKRQKDGSFRILVDTYSGI